MTHDGKKNAEETSSKGSRGNVPVTCDTQALIIQICHHFHHCRKNMCFFIICFQVTTQNVTYCGEDCCGEKD